MRYSTGDSYDFSGSEVRTDIDLSQFDGLEVVAAFETAKEQREQIIFKVGVGGSILSPMVLHEGVLYFGCADKNFYAVDTNGKELWRYGTEGAITGRANVRDGVVCFGSYDSSLYCTTLKGKLLFKFATEGKILSTPNIDKDRVYVGSRDGNLYSINLNTGKETWRYMTSEGISGGVIHKDGVIVFGSDDMNLYGVNEDGGLLWRFPINEKSMSIVDPEKLVFNDTIAIGCWDFNMYCIRLDGNLAWKFRAKDVTYYPAVHIGRTYFGSRDGNLYCVDARAGREKWRFPTGGYVATQPLVRDGRIYFGSGDCNLYCLSLDGKELWRFPTGGPLVSSPAMDEKGIYFGSWDCNLYAVSHEGKLLWKFPTSLSYQSSIDLESTKARETAHQVVWSEVGERPDRYDQNLPGRLSDYGDGLDTYQSIGSKTYMAGTEKKYKPKSEYR